MKRSNKVTRRKRGRPPGSGKGATHPLIALRVPIELTAKIDDWARANTVGRSEAIRRLVEKGLAGCQPAGEGMP